MGLDFKVIRIISTYNHFKMIGELKEERSCIKLIYFNQFSNFTMGRAIQKNFLFYQQSTKASRKNSLTLLQNFNLINFKKRVR